MNKLEFLGSSLERRELICELHHVPKRCTTVSIHLVNKASRREEIETNYASTAQKPLFPPSSARAIVASRCASVHLLLHDLYYGNSARTTSQLTFDNNAAASEKAACRGGGAATAGVATRPGEALSLSLYLRWSTQVNQELYLPPPLMPYREMCGLLRASRRSVKPVDSL